MPHSTLFLSEIVRTDTNAADWPTFLRPSVQCRQRFEFSRPRPIEAGWGAAAGIPTETLWSGNGANCALLNLCDRHLLT